MEKSNELSLTLVSEECLLQHVVVYNQAINLKKIVLMIFAYLPTRFLQLPVKIIGQRLEKTGFQLLALLICECFYCGIIEPKLFWWNWTVEIRIEISVLDLQSVVLCLLLLWNCLLIGNTFVSAHTFSPKHRNRYFAKSQ